MYCIDMAARADDCKSFALYHDRRLLDPADEVVFKHINVEAISQGTCMPQKLYMSGMEEISNHTGINAA